jgi:hypothetical protein
MSQENVERTLLLYDAWNRRDPEAVMPLVDPEAVWFPAVEGDAEGGRTYSGHTGMPPVLCGPGGVDRGRSP